MAKDLRNTTPGHEDDGLELRELTDAEKAALTFGHFNGIRNWAQMFDICMTCNTKSQLGKSEAVSRWKHSPEVQRYWKELDRLEKIKIQEGVKAEIAKGNYEAKGELGIRDFTDINQFISYLNEQANTIHEEKDRQTYLKMLSDLLRFKDSANDKSADIMRFYVPIPCPTCPLYQNERKLIDEEERRAIESELEKAAEEIEEDMEKEEENYKEEDEN